MNRIRSTRLENSGQFENSGQPEEISDSIYSCGECHVHAMAAAHFHETPVDDRDGILIVSDQDSIWWEDDNDPDKDVHTVVHVYSLHQVDGQTIARDVFGDRLESDVLEEVREVFGVARPMSEHCSLEVLQGLSRTNKCGFPGLFKEVTYGDLLKALMEPSVMVPLAPGPLKTCEEEPAP